MASTQPNDEWLTVGRLIALLENLPQDMRIIYSCCSDWVPMENDDIEIARGILKSGYIMRLPQQAHRADSWDAADIREFVAFPGN